MTNDLNILALALNASWPVKCVLALLIGFSIASWFIIFRKKAMLDRANASADEFEERFWSGADAGTLTIGDAVKRGGISSCSGIWLNCSENGPRYTLHIKKLVVRMTKPGTIIEVENGPADIQIEACDIDAPAGTRMIRFDDGAGEVQLGVGCELPRSSA